MPTVHKTTDYSQFKIIKKNRDISPEYLIKSIKEKNLLEASPITVNKDLQVIDGQNRLKAAEVLGLPIYYTINDGLTEEDIPRLQIQNPWELRDYLKYYKNRPDYEFIAEAVKQYGVHLHFAVICCSSMVSPYRAFRNGTYRITKDKEKLMELFLIFKEASDLIKEITKLSLTIKASQAIWSLVSRKDYNHSKFLKKCEKYKSDLKKAMKWRDKGDMIESLIEDVYLKGDEGKKKKIEENEL